MKEEPSIQDLSKSSYFTSLPERAPSSLQIQEEGLALTSFDGAQLSAKWTFPEGSTQGILLLLPGSGTVGIDGDLSSPLLGCGYQGAPAKLSDQLAHYLATHGLASFRYAKRGFDDPAQTLNQTQPFLLNDSLAAFQFIRRQYPQMKVGIVGFSEGALLAALLAIQEPVDGLFLLSLLTRSLREAIEYQFLEWPIQLLKRKLTFSGKKENASSFQNVQLPLLGPGFQGVPWQTVTPDLRDPHCLERDLIPAYRKNFEIVESLLASPAFSGWFQSFNTLPSFSQLAQKISAPMYVYQGSEDAQFPSSLVEADQVHFKSCKAFRLFQGLGHCFSPMEGPLGERKTSGPFDPTLLEAVTTDIIRTFS